MRPYQWLLLLLVATACPAPHAGPQDGGSDAGPVDAGAPPAVTLTMDSFTVPAGAEVYECQNFKNPFAGQDTDVSGFESHMTQGGAHVTLFYADVTENGALEGCSGLEFDATPYNSQSIDDALTFPSGIATTVPGTSGLRLQAHYLNATASDLTANVSVTLQPATPGTVQTHAGVLFVADSTINVMAHSTDSDSDDCVLPSDMNLIRAQSLMHSHGTHFLATVADQTVYETEVWSDPTPAEFAPALSFHQGDALHVECSFNNTTSNTLIFGESELTAEMCLFYAWYYPATQPTISASQCTAGQN